MKQIPILSGKAMIVELPEGAETIHLAFNDGFWHLIYFTYHGEILTRKRMPSGRWRIIGMLSEVTEEGLKGILEQEVDFDISPVGEFFMKTVSRIESLESAILAEGYYLDKNPVPPFNERLNDWIGAQSRVLCRERCLLLGREN